MRLYYQPVQLAVDGDSIWLASYPDVYGLTRKSLDLEAMVRDLAKQAAQARRDEKNSLQSISEKRQRETGEIRENGTWEAW